MKRLLISLTIAILGTFSAKAIGYTDARESAWFLTDKMAYELNLTSEQCDMVYQINLDYLLSVNYEADCFGNYWRYRDADLRYILWDWQYNLYASIDYFFRPLRWMRSAWYYPVRDHYRYGYYYFDRPRVYVSYHGMGWRRRGHNDISPYRGWNRHTGPGMRDNYHGGRPGGRPDYRPEPGNNRGGHGNGRYDNNKPGKDRPGYRDNNHGNKPGNDRGTGNRPGYRDNNRGNTQPGGRGHSTGNTRRDNGRSNGRGGNTTTPSRTGHNNSNGGRTFGR